MKEFLSENYNWNDAKLKVEGGGRNEDGSLKNLYLKGICMQAEITNRNGRIYPKDEISRVVNEVNEVLKSESIVGELDHPESLNVSLDRAACSIESLHMEGNDVIGKLKVLSTTHGNTARVLIEDGIKLGVSSRGSGNVEESYGGAPIVRDFQFVTIDIVNKPSAQKAYPQPVYEALTLEHFLGEKTWMKEDLAESMIHDHRAQYYLQRELKAWIEQLKNK